MDNMYALLVECDPGTTLGGSCLRDVQNMANHLISRCGVLPKNITITTTGVVPKPKMIPEVLYESTRTFFKSFKDILERCNENSKIVVLLSGHGFSVGDRNKDERDGRDEAIQTGGGMVIDDSIRSNIVVPAKEKDVKLILLSDTCHSGTMFDLANTNTNTNNTPEDKIKIYSMSACSDSQLSMCDVGDTTGFGGSLTTAVLNLNNVLEDLITSKTSNVKNAYKKIQNQLQKLHQNVIFERE